MRSRFVLSLMIAAVLLPSLAAAEMNFSGFVSNRFWVRLPQDTTPEEREEGKDYGEWDILMQMTQLDLVGRASNEERTGRLFVDLDLRYNPVGEVFENDTDFRLREAYGGFYSQYVSFEVGKKIYAWGKADEFNPTDLINPEDYRFFVTFDKPDRKTGVFSGNVAFTYDKFAWQTVFIPVFTPDILPKLGSDWITWDLEALLGIAADFPDLVTLERDQRPKPTLKNSNIASRLTGTIARVDIEAVYFNGYDPLPTYDIGVSLDPALFFAGKAPLAMVEEYQRYQAFGGSLATTAGKFGFRGEGAYSTPRYWMHDIDRALLHIDYPVPYDEIIPAIIDKTWRSRHPSWSAAAGVDWRKGAEIYVNLQYVHTQILDYDPDLLDKEHEGIVTAKIQTKWLDEDLEAGLDGAFNVWHGDHYFKPYVKYKFTADFSGELGTRIFSGKSETRFGDMDKNDFVYSTFKYTF